LIFCDDGNVLQTLMKTSGEESEVTANRPADENETSDQDAQSVIKPSIKP
jgi:hypothetical protein